MVNKIRNIIILILYASIIPLISCQTSKNIEGVYSAKKNLNRFVLFSDSTFTYQATIPYGGSRVDKYSDGTWSRIGKNSIILNSRKKNNLIPIHIEKSMSDNTQISINLVITQTKITNPRWEYTDKDYLLTPYINGRNYLELHPELSDEPVTINLREMIGLPSDKSEKDVINVPPVKRGNHCLSFDEPIEDIYFEIEKRPQILSHKTYYRLKTEKANLSMQPNESFVVNIALNDSLFSYRIFDNVILKINNKKLTFMDNDKSDETNKLYLIK